VPPVAVIDVGGPAVFVKENTASGVTPGTEALTEYDPTVVLAVKIADVATPDAFVMAVATPFANAPPAPLAGAVNVTVTPFTGLLLLSRTVAIRLELKAAPRIAD
jgi:hypothetical protein